MIIGNLPKKEEMVELSKWYIWVEILKCPPEYVGIFKPMIYCGVYKLIDPGEPHLIQGRKKVTKEFTRMWVFSYGIRIEILK